jgi:hypothetical protein
MQVWGPSNRRPIQGSSRFRQGWSEGRWPHHATVGLPEDDARWAGVRVPLEDAVVSAGVQGSRSVREANRIVIDCELESTVEQQPSAA